ncbi:MAG: holo-ACP synthase [Candidatus Margulisbacteria bacterium]|nr:holo-ACP synthase [Candidatus Margulisiibacteriota bacterium]
MGIDIIEIDRVRDAVESYGDKFLNKVYTPHEIKRCTGLNKYRIPELAVRFAAKEAYSKALGKGIAGFGRNDHGIRWTDVEIRNDKLGKPMIAYKGKINKNTYISLSHSREYAVASVVIE